MAGKQSTANGRKGTGSRVAEGARKWQRDGPGNADVGIPGPRGVGECDRVRDPGAASRFLSAREQDSGGCGEYGVCFDIQFRCSLDSRLCRSNGVRIVYIRIWRDGEIPGPGCFIVGTIENAVPGSPTFTEFNSFYLECLPSGCCH